MKTLTAFLIGVCCCGLGYAAMERLGWLVGMTCALAIITVDHVLEFIKSEVEA